MYVLTGIRHLDTGSRSCVHRLARSSESGTKNYQLAGNHVWEETKLMSPWAARPLVIAMIKEERETLIPFFRKYVDPQVHLLTHYSSNPAWHSSEFCLWSPRGRRVVGLEECRIQTVLNKVNIRNPIRLEHKLEEGGVEEQMEEQMEVEVDREGGGEWQGGLERERGVEKEGGVEVSKKSVRSRSVSCPRMRLC